MGMCGVQFLFSADDDGLCNGRKDEERGKWTNIFPFSFPLCAPSSLPSEIPDIRQSV